MEHGNKMDTSTKVGVTLTMEESRLQVAVKDEGKGFGEINAPSIESKIEGKDETRGWGIFLIKSLMNEVKIEPSPEGGNVVKTEMYLGKHPDGVRHHLHAIRGFAGLVELHGYSGRFGTGDIQ
jgi:anti-sigma regulatory factor (Ser/Thr protein kinase)